MCSFVSRTRPDDMILFISDHGFQSVTRTIHMDHLLKQFGFLEFSASNVVFGPRCRRGSSAIRDG